VLGVAPTKDIALVQLQGASGLPTASLGDSGSVKVGDSVVAIGNALGQGGAPTVTHGTVTALNRTITASDGSGSSEQLSGMIQTNASISPGDSGGALANSAGQVIGVITAGASRRFGRSSSTNIGFAVPSNTASQIAKQIESGRSDATVIIGTPGYLGVAVRDLDSNAAANLGLGITAGVLVVDVPSGSPAARLGIGANSVIIAIDGKHVNSSSDLGSAIHSHRPGEQIQVTWVNRSGTHNGTATLVSGPAA
jgi:S1-C subfamily serine protease